MSHGTGQGVVTWDRSGVVTWHRSGVVTWDRSGVVTWDKSGGSHTGQGVVTCDRSGVVTWDRIGAVPRDRLHQGTDSDRAVESYVTPRHRATDYIDTELHMSTLQHSNRHNPKTH